VRFFPIAQNDTKERRITIVDLSDKDSPLVSASLVSYISLVSGSDAN